MRPQPTCIDPLSRLSLFEVAALAVLELGRCMRNRMAQSEPGPAQLVFDAAARQLLARLEGAPEAERIPRDILERGLAALRTTADRLPSGRLDELETDREALRLLRDALSSAFTDLEESAPETSPVRMA